MWLPFNHGVSEPKEGAASTSGKENCLGATELLGACHPRLVEGELQRSLRMERTNRELNVGPQVLSTVLTGFTMPSLCINVKEKKLSTLSGR
jgi:hypothetical protein